MPAVMKFTFSESPSPELALMRYDPAAFPQFRIVFETPSPEGLSTITTLCFRATASRTQV